MQIMPLFLFFGLLLGGAISTIHAQASPLPGFDFTDSTQAREWHPAHHISQVEPTGEGLRVHISSYDPYLHGPARDYPEGTALWLRVRLKSESGGGAQIFYYHDRPREENSVRFVVPAGQWFETRVAIPALGRNHRLRLDPPGATGTCVLALIQAEERPTLTAPDWTVPVAPEARPDDLIVQSGDLKLRHDGGKLGGFMVEVGGERMAAGHSNALMGYQAGKQTRWLPFGNCPDNPPTVEQVGDGLAVTSRWHDPDGAAWVVEQIFTPAKLPGAIDVESRVTVNQERSAVHLPMFMLLPGLGSFETNKTQGLFAGLEYLANEAGSSELDLEGPASRRQVPAPHKITMPLMVISERSQYVGLMWEPRPYFCALFDSPDRVFGSKGHLFGILFPGSSPGRREENNLVPYGGENIAANSPLILRATLLGGKGASVVPAIQQYVALGGLPDVPDPGMSGTEYFRLAAHGWLDSRGREGNLYRHAVWPGFGPQPAADAALHMDWLAQRVDDPALGSRLATAAEAALSEAAPAHWNFAGIGHIRYPAPALVYGSVVENAAEARRRGHQLLNRFEPDGSVHYRKREGGVDYGRTHFALDANGLTAGVVAQLLELAAFAGDRELIQRGLKHLRAMNKFRDDVPRGAQTWEIALHTPDILASAHLVRAYTLGYELTGEGGFLEQARYWAWTGVPFVYLTPPTDGEVGLYNTIAVLGATTWVAPVWIGLPVQWCGMVYADALYRFARHDPDGPWKQMAAGITAGGIQHTWPVDDRDRQGLLPDFFDLPGQYRDGPAINPATVQVGAARLFGETPVYDFRAFPEHELLVHAPGEIKAVRSDNNGIAFELAAALPQPHRVLINGLRETPRVRINGEEVALGVPHQYLPEEGRLILKSTAGARIEIMPSGRERGSR